jgi:hypothetical protein
LYFVIEGVQRVYYFDDQSREATLVFTYAPSFYLEYATKAPTFLYFQILQGQFLQFLLSVLHFKW